MDDVYKIPEHIEQSIDCALNDAIALVKGNHDNYCTIMILEEGASQRAPLTVICKYKAKKVWLECRVDLDHFSSSNPLTASQAALFDVVIFHIGSDFYCNEEGVVTFFFEDNKEEALDALLFILNNSRYAEEYQANIFNVLCRPNRKDINVNYINYHAEGAVPEYVVADARHVKHGVMCPDWANLHQAIKDLHSNQIDGNFSATTYVTTADATNISEEESILTIVGNYYNGTRPAKENYCVMLPYVYGVPGHDDAARVRAINEAVEFAKALPGIRFMNPYGKNEEIDASEIQGCALCIRCGSNRAMAENIASQILAHLGYSPSDIMATTI